MNWNKLQSRSKQWLQSRQGKNLMSMVGAEAIAKSSRIVTLIAMAAFLLPTEYGIAMLTLAWHDMVRLILRCGAGSQIVQCEDSQLPAMAQNAMAMQWVLCLLLALLQYYCAPLIGDFYETPKLTELLQALSGVYLLYPFVSVKVFLIQRSNRLGWFGFCNGFCVVIENLSIAVILFLGGDISAIVYGKYIYAVLWIALFHPVATQTFGVGFQWAVFCKLFRNSFRLFQSELSRSLRINVDLFMAGKLLSPEVFGIYSFAKSASVAISQSLSNAVVSALYPQFCIMHRQGSNTRQIKLLLVISLFVCCAYVLQSATAHLYIPLFFGERWQSAITATVFLCLSAVPAFFLDMLCATQRSVAAFGTESNIRLGHLLTLMATILWLQPATPLAMALLVLSASSVWMLCCLMTFSKAIIQFSREHLLISQFVIKPQEKSL